MTPPTSQRRESPQASERAVDSKTPIEDTRNHSDGESGEKPVREKLRDTTIDGQPAKESVSSSAQPPAEHAELNGIVAAVDRSKLRRKRSIDDVEYGDKNEAPAEPPRHIRKRSHDESHKSDSAAPHELDAEELMRDAMVTAHKTSPRRAVTPIMAPDSSEETEPKAGLISPKGKRTRDQVLQDEEVSTQTEPLTLGTTVVLSDQHTSSTERVESEEERKSKRTRDNQALTAPHDEAVTETGASLTKIPSAQESAEKSVPSSFATTRAVISPIQSSVFTSTSSGFGSFAGNASPFGNSTSGNTSSFGPSKTVDKASVFVTSGSTFGGSKGAMAAFGGTAVSTMIEPNASTFGSAFSMKPSVLGGASGFGLRGGSSATFGSGFAAANEGPKLSSFAGGSGPKIESSKTKPTLAFGTTTGEAIDEEKEDASDDEESGIKSPGNEEVKKDKRFYEQSVETGEENETTIFLQRAKLYSFSAVPPNGEKNWVERGVGNLKLNVTDAVLPDCAVKVSGDDVDAKKKTKARFVMRAEGSHRVVLNSPVQKGGKFGTESGQKPKDGRFCFLGRPEGSDRLETMMLKLKVENAQQLWERVRNLQDDV